MGYVTALFAMSARMLRPTRGVHTSPCGYFLELFAEFRRNRARRVRRYAENVPFVSEVEPRPEPAPFVPAPRQPLDDAPHDVLVPVPADYVPVIDTKTSADPRALEDPEELVPGYYREWERQEALRRVDRSRLGVAVLHTIAEHGEAA